MWKQHKALISLLGHTWNEATQKFGFQRLQWPKEGTTALIRPLLAPFEAVKNTWKAVYQEHVNLELIAIPGITAAEWKITDIIEYVCGNTILLSLFVAPLVCLEVIIKCDAFPVAGGQCFLLSVTFGNFGLLCKCTALHFVAAIATCSDKDRDLIAKVVATNFRIIDELAGLGSIFIKALGKAVAISFVFGGDDKVLRLITGLAPSCGKWCCFYCYWLHNLHPSVAQNRCQ
jgi:hypothetical protein